METMKGCDSMKKLSLLTLIFITILLIGCTEERESSYSVILPNGTPAFSQILIEHASMEGENAYSIERVAGPQVLSAAFLGDDYDFIFAPVNLGANLIAKGADYKLAAVVTWGNLQLLSTSPINTLDDIKDKEIVAFGNGSIPQMLLDMVLDHYDDTLDFNVSYTASSVQESFMSIVQNPDIVVLVAQPITTMALGRLEEVYIFDIEKYWKEEMALTTFPQAGVFVSNDLSSNSIEDFLSDLENSIRVINDDPEVAGQKAERLDYPFDSDLITNSIPFSGINFTTAENALESLETFFELLYNFNPDLIGNKLPDESFYYLRP